MAPEREASGWASEACCRRPLLRLYNRIGNDLRRRGVRRDLAAEDIRAAAERHTGLKKQASEYCDQALEVLVRSYEAQSRLHSWGRFLLRCILVQLCKNRLLIDRYIADIPGVKSEEISKPLFVLGLPRTGTTLLAGLLAQDPAARPLMSWETFWPVPQEKGVLKKKDRRRRDIRRLEWTLARLLPGLRYVHPIRADRPEECTWLMANTFTSPAFGLFGSTPDYDAWLDEQGKDYWRAVYGDYKRQLQVLQHQSRGSHWVLKSPVHLYSLPMLLEVFPDARIVHSHRDPREAVASACSLFALVRSLFSDDVREKELGGVLCRRLKFMLDRGDECRSSFGNRIMDVEFEDLVHDQLGTVKAIYDRFGLSYSPAVDRRLRDWLRRDRGPGRHVYDLARFGLSSEYVEAVWNERGRGRTVG